MVKTCPICGKEFEFNHGNRKYCSKECARIKQREWNRHYHQEHKEELLEYGRKYYQEHKKELQEYTRQYYQDHREIILERQRQRRQQRNIDPRCVKLGLSCFECPYEDCKY